MNGSFQSYLGSDDVRQMNVAIDRIAEAIIASRVEFLFGAGMSAGSNVPIGTALSVELLRAFFSSGSCPPNDRLMELAQQLPLEAIAEATELNLGTHRGDLTTLLQKLYNNSAHQLSQAHKDFASICVWDGIPRLAQIFTTNFDPLLERALEGLVAPVTNENTSDLHKIRRQGQIPLIYLHGKLDSKYQLTERDLFDQKPKSTKSSFVSALADSDAFVFVGYSMSDPDFRKVYMDFQFEIDQAWQQRKSTYIVSPAKDEHIYTIGKHVWLSRGAIWIPLTANDFFARLKTRLTDRSNKTDQDTIMTKYSLADDSDFEDKVSKTQEILRVGRTDAIRFLLETRPRTAS